MKVSCEAGRVKPETQDVHAAAHELYARYGTYVEAWDAATNHRKRCRTVSREYAFWYLVIKELGDLRELFGL